MHTDQHRGISSAMYSLCLSVLIWGFSPSNCRPADASKASDDIPVTIRGRVLDPEGKPFGGASVRLLYQRADDAPREQDPMFRTSSDPDGRFEFKVETSAFDRSMSDEPWNFLVVLAQAKGFGFDAVEVKRDAESLGGEENADRRAPHSRPLFRGERGEMTAEVTLQLVDDLLIHGRILDLQGNPVTGATIRTLSCRWNTGKPLDPYLDAIREGRYFAYRFERQISFPTLIDLDADPVRTDADGRFEVRGIGAERIVSLEVQGPAIERAELDVMTRETESAIEPADAITRSRNGRVYGAQFEHLAAASRPIVGTVRDQATGKPLAGVKVRAMTQRFPAKTDEQGRFEVLGLPKSEKCKLRAVPPEGQAFLPASLTVADSGGLAPLEIEIALHKSPLCQGRLTDTTTGRPVSGWLQYFPLYPNAHAAKEQPESIGRPCSETRIKADGRFALPVLPGPGVMAVTAGRASRDFVPMPITPDDLKTFFYSTLNDTNSEEQLRISLGGTAISAIHQPSYIALVLINPDEGTESFTKDVSLEPGRKLRGTVLDADGNPLTGTEVYGLTHNYAAETLKTAEFEVVSLGQRPRVLRFTHAEKKLGLALTVDQDAAEPLVVHLRPFGSATGRLLDREGEPLRDARVQFFPGGHIGPGTCAATTDRDGRFRVEGLVDGQEYRLTFADKQMLQTLTEVTGKATENQEFGDLQLGKPRRRDHGRD